VQSGIVDTAPPITQQTLERGKALREAMFRLVATLINHQTASATDCALVNAAGAEVPPPCCGLTTTDCTAPRLAGLVALS
jgi:hypothetical protein